MACDSRHLSVDGDSEKLLTPGTRKRKCDKNDDALSCYICLHQTLFLLIGKRHVPVYSGAFQTILLEDKEGIFPPQPEMRSSGVLLLQLLLLIVPHIRCWNDDAVLLRDVQVLTLYKGRYTTARRSSPVLQLQCAGGTAGCGSFVPEVVQCYNRGSDGVDTQWECKADMDNLYRFGRVEVSCEGYSSPNDAYVLRGSCGLEYTLELTAEGKQQNNHGSSGFSGFASNFFQGSSNQKQQHRGDPYQQADSQYSSQNSPSGDGVGGLIAIAFLLLVAYVVYKMFLCSPSHGHQGYNADGTQGYGGASDNSHGMGPPPPGFKPDYYSEDHSSSRPGYGFSDSYTRPQSSGTGFTAGTGFTGGNRAGGGGFWTGMGTGGILGYLFGSQRRQPPMGFARPSYSNNPSPAPKTSSGTRTASGFGGTKRR